MSSEPQQRVAAILAFREELARLEAGGIATLDDAAKARIRAHHDEVLSALAASGEVDLSARAARLSIGMRVATLLGTIALSAAYAFFVSAHWGQLGEAAQLALVILPPILLVGLTHLAARREPSGYVAALLATVAAIALAVNLGTLGTLYNLPDSRRVFLATGLFALLLAYGYRLTLPLLVAIGGLGGWLWSLGAIPLGLWWRDGFLLMEPLLLVGVLAFAVPAVTRGPAAFAPWWRGVGTAAIVLGLLMVQSNGHLSMLTTVDPDTVALAYKILGAAVLAALITWGIRHGSAIVTRIATTGAVLYLFLRLVDWFWDLVPKWAFFLIVGGFALAVLLGLRRLRRLAGGQA
ncbi:MAG: DUF2157 domain-containing protein [Gemmatimonadales bacterium]